MNTLQDIFEEESFKKLAIKLISQKAQQNGYSITGYSLTDKQLEEIKEQVARSDEDTFTIELPDDNIDPEISIEEEDVDRILDEHTKHLSSEVQKASQKASEVVLDKLRDKASEMLREHEEIKDNFELRLWQRWREGFELLKMFIVIAYEAGNEFNREFREFAAQERDCQFDVLTRLHARSCQITNEILTLLRSGCADGAHARWRALHEIAVIGFFISEFGEDVAERYLLHNTVESYRAAIQYRSYSSQLGYETLPDQGLAKVQYSYQQLINRFGDCYANNYGWAAEALGKKNSNFSEIEQAIGLSHWRPHYRFASQSVHATPKEISFTLGLYRSDQEVLLAGPSDADFADPAHSAAISLLQISTFLLMLKPNIDRLCVCHILSKLAKEIGETLLSIQKAQEESK